MHKTVDKDEGDELAIAHAIVRCLLLCDVEANNDLSRLLSRLVRKHVRDRVLLPECDIKGLCFC